MSAHDRGDGANAHMGGGGAGRFPVWHRRIGAGLQAEAESRSVLRSAVRIPEQTIDVGKNTRFYDGIGFWLCQKRLSKGRFCWWPKTDDGTLKLEAHQLQLLLAGGDPAAAKGMRVWRELPAAV